MHTLEAPTPVEPILPGTRVDLGEGVIRVYATLAEPTKIVRYTSGILACSGVDILGRPFSHFRDPATGKFVTGPEREKRTWGDDAGLGPASQSPLNTATLGMYEGTHGRSDEGVTGVTDAIFGVQRQPKTTRAGVAAARAALDAGWVRRKPVLLRDHPTDSN